MRFITVTLLLLVFFFGGMMYGTFEKSNTDQEIELVVPQVTSPPPVVEQEIHELNIVHVEEQDYLVNKTASLLEQIVSTMYEGLINIMYKIAEMFFD